jgi:hypothetical protein
MQWSDVTRRQSVKTLRQFGFLGLGVFGALAGWRAFASGADGVVWGFGAAAAGFGLLGAAAPAALGPVFTAWMIVAFPIGWVVSRVMLALLFYGVFTPVAFVFRLMGRDVLRRRRPAGGSYWIPKSQPGDARQYLRQF